MLGCGPFGCVSVVVLGLIGLAALLLGAVVAVEEQVNEAIGRGSTSWVTPSGSQVLPLAGLDGLVLDGGGAQPVEVATAIYDAREGRRHLARVRLGAGATEAEVLWRSEPLPAGVIDAPMVVAGGDVVLAGVGAEVWAVSAVDGVVRWKATLPDTVQSGCSTCFAMAGDVLVVRTNDAQIVAFQAGSPEPRWQRRLESTSGGYVVSGAGLAVVDDLPDEASAMGVVVVDPTTGATVSQVRPTCQLGSRTLDFGFTDVVYAVPDSADLVATVTFGGTCVMRWDGTTGAVRWTTAVDEPSALRREPALVSGGRLFLTSHDATYGVDLETGALGALPAPPDTRVQPAAVVDGVLVAYTETTRGTSRWGLVGIDPAAPAVLWERPLPEGAAPFNDRGTTDALLSGAPRTHLAADGDRALVVVFDGDARTVSRTTVDPRTGDAATLAAVPFGDRSGIPSALVHRAARGAVLFSVDSALWYVTEAGDVQRWPA